MHHQTWICIYFKTEFHVADWNFLCNLGSPNLVSHLLQPQCSSTGVTGMCHQPSGNKLEPERTFSSLEGLESRPREVPDHSDSRACSEAPGKAG